MEKYSHIVTDEDLASHPEVFVESAVAGDHVLLAANDLVLLGITSHTVTEDDLVNNPDAEVKVGDVLPVPDVEGFSTLEKETEIEGDKGDSEVI